MSSISNYYLLEILFLRTAVFVILNVQELSEKINRNVGASMQNFLKIKKYF